jgi:rSAM/selenodomain-associated transferase 2
MLVSVIIPTLNEAEHIQQLLDDLQPLREAGGELIVVDGGSTDATCQLARAQVDQLLQTTAGRARQMNAGAASASGSHLWFVHADTRVSAEVLAALLAACRGDLLWGRFDLRLSGERRLFRVIETLINWRSRLSGVATGDQGMLVAKTAFKSAGGFPDMPLMEDVALSKKLRKMRWPHCFTTRLWTSSRRWEESGVWRTILLMWWLRLAYFVGVPADRLAGYYARQDADRAR